MTDRQSFFSVTFISKRRNYVYSFSIYFVNVLIYIVLWVL